MSNVAATAEAGLSWNLAAFRERPGRMTGIVLVLALRYLFGIFNFGAGLNKFRLQWLHTDALQQVFTARLAELEPGTFAATFLEKFAIPLYLPIAWIVTWAELIAGAGLLLGLATRINAALAVWLMVMFAIGGYYDASLLALWLIGALFIVLPTGHWLGMDRKLHQRHPDSIWFK